MQRLASSLCDETVDISGREADRSAWLRAKEEGADPSLVEKSPGRCARDLQSSRDSFKADELRKAVSVSVLRLASHCYLLHSHITQMLAMHIACQRRGWRSGYVASSS